MAERDGRVQELRLDGPIEDTLRRATVNRRRLVYLGLVLVLIAAVVGTGSVALDRLGYCVEDVLPGDADLTTDPFVQHVTRDSAVISWWTPDDTTGTVTWGLGEAFDDEISVATGESHAAILTGLETGQEYRYRVQSDGINADGIFRTAPDETATVTIGVIGDTGTGGENQRQVAALLDDFDPDIVLHTGDVVYRRGALCDYGEKFFAPYEEIIDSAPIYAAVGNHDLLADNGAAFDAVFGPQEARSGRWFSVDYGPAHVVVLDSETYHSGEDSAIADQRAWLEADLRDSALPWVLVVLHRPLMSSTKGQADPSLLEEFGSIFARHGVDLVLSGHAHNYERFAPVAGVTYVVTGGGGAPLHELSSGAESGASAEAHHAVKLVVSPTSLSLEAIEPDGTILDRYHISAET